jgi:hypothetical protein
MSPLGKVAMIELEDTHWVDVAAVPPMRTLG